MSKRGVCSLGICVICLFIISVPLFAEDQADPLDAADKAVSVPNEVTDTLKLPIKYNPKTMSVEKCNAILLSSPGTNIALEAQAHLIAHEIYTQKATDIQLSMQSLYQQYGSLSSMPRAVKIIASAYEEKKDYAAVIPLYTEAINTLKDKKGEYWLKGSLVRAYIETGQNDKADALITEVLAKGLADSSNANSLEIFLSPLNTTDKTLPAAVRGVEYRSGRADDGVDQDAGGCPDQGRSGCRGRGAD
jgi:tetratricopeptide (TPR) repeat protein